MEQDLEEDLSKKFSGLFVCYLRWEINPISFYYLFCDYNVRDALLNVFSYFIYNSHKIYIR